VDHGRRLGGGVCAARAQCLPPQLQSAGRRNGRVCGRVVHRLSLLPFFFQKFVVQPSELALETPYLKNYIEFTRRAYQLDAIQETSYPALADLTPEVIGGTKTRSRIFVCGTRGRCFRPINRPRRYASTTSSITWTPTVITWRTAIIR